MTDEHASAVLLMAYGSPGSLEEVEEYLRNVREGVTPTTEQVQHLKEKYRQVGGRTPLLEITMAQASCLEVKLRSEGMPVRVSVGMKHWHPFIENTVEKITGEGVRAIVGLALAPHYSRLSIGGYEERVRRGLTRAKSNATLRMVRTWHTEPFLVKAISKKVRERLESFSDPSKAAVLFTAHSLPKAAVREDDPYGGQLLETARLVVEQAGVNHWDFAYQSAGHPPDVWLGPQIKEEISSLSAKGFREILVCPIGFVSDHLEILYDLDIEARNYAKSLGVSLERSESLNTDPEFIKALASVTISHLKLEGSVIVG